MCRAAPGRRNVDRSSQRVPDREGGRAEIDVVTHEGDFWQNGMSYRSDGRLSRLATSDYGVAPVPASVGESSNNDADACARATRRGDLALRKIEGKGRIIC
ncbi:MAG: hypothetical protein DMF84_28920 [Acidobacteria bacterium]|nr:MAG: hypothetical protein DMF84_28920 [Acidobacteriota bacterium]